MSQVPKRDEYEISFHNFCICDEMAYNYREYADKEVDIRELGEGGKDGWGERRRNGIGSKTGTMVRRRGGL